jgi:Tol biopolymer transport system component
VHLLIVTVVVVVTMTLTVRPSSAAFPGANGKIAFDSDRDGNAEIYVMNADGSGQTNLTNNAASDSSASWSPDGSRLAFVSTRDGNAEIYVMNADGSGQNRLTTNAVNDFRPSWSPDGSKIVFGRDTVEAPGTFDIYTMNPDGTGATNLTNHPANDDGPVWSPDGSRIAFGSTRDGGSFHIWVMNSDGTNPTNLTPARPNSALPDWSPDGAKLTFYAGISGHDVFVMNADGTGQTDVSGALGASEFCPVWSPDGTKIALNSDRDGNHEIYVMGADGTNPVRLTTTVPAASDVCPDWQPAFQFSGFFAPVDNPPVFNGAKAGTAIPVKFGLGGDKGLDIFATGYPASRRIACDTSVGLDLLEETVTAGSSGLSYDAATDTYTYVWKTAKSWANTCRELNVKLSDGSSHVAYFQFR